ncbi:aspartate/glutamate racemase family protein [Providencia rettgeri]|uniref:Aspartate/glutamate racemase family protein n=1 Tax=Providencia rettgeri TaxID=587 RepID=A0AAP2NVS1_PRORE|nr:MULTISPECIES: amino acid racemase [Providencia]MBX6954896.1 aspartate/glutamate racemase family protein [Providencia rettgeri]MBX6959023.1 aspartate/glutamate racemase family protein [Providencia rettgeri]MBX6971944.1 aspartate/glutamate racemase family protein [Providencia rettgeri]MBX6980611.1 aspartate/glutamate racemase family protein [Providencia rettgeri]MBX6984519.1 aspartate/glutamate racemase family protein [Providencia rettgeri]
MKKILGMLGGMGPGATADAFIKLINNTHASKDQEHIPIIIVSLPDIPDRTENIIYNGPSPLPAMIHSLKILESAGVSCIIMPCNTAHYWYEDLKKEININFISIIDAACKKIIEDNVKKVALLATTATIHTKLYQEKLNVNNIECIVPDEVNQYKIMQSIILYKSGDLAKARELLYPYISQLKSRGIDKFVMGCTEIPLILDELSKNNPEDFIDATEALIKEAINWYTIDEKREVDEEKTNKLIEFH